MPSIAGNKSDRVYLKAQPVSQLGRTGVLFVDTTKPLLSIKSVCVERSSSFSAAPVTPNARYRRYFPKHDSPN